MGNVKTTETGVAKVATPSELVVGVLTTVQVWLAVIVAAPPFPFVPGVARQFARVLTTAVAVHSAAVKVVAQFHLFAVAATLVDKQ